MTGIGGQGIILASDVVGNTALNSQYDIKKTDTLGMAQRGGSVVSHIRIADKVYSPLIKEGNVDILLAFEKLEAARWTHFLKDDGFAIINNYSSPPFSVSIGNEEYPSDDKILTIIKRRTQKIKLIRGNELANKIGSVKSLNILLLGCISTLMPFPVEVWKESISRHLPSTLHEINLAAFDYGRKEMEHAHR
jgi:indolepyruvate ferredoxin oxidoreductase beta subunit